MGNVVLWKPSDNQMYTAKIIMDIFEEAGLPSGVINLVSGDPILISEIALSHPEFSGLHFTGSTTVFKELWKKIGNNIFKYRDYPRIVGETGGKDFIFCHASAKIDSARTEIIRGGFEYQGQKCSAASRSYIPTSVWNSISEELCSEISKIKIGDAKDFSNFMTAVIDQRAFNKIKGYIERARDNPNCEIIIGGNCDDSKGWFIEPTIILSSDPKSETMVEEIFGPVLTIYIYDDDKFENILKLCDKSSPYALTGSIFANNEEDIQTAFNALRFTACLLYTSPSPRDVEESRMPSSA